MKVSSVLTRLFSNWPARIISLTVAIILYLFYRVNTLDERFFSVKLVLKLPQGYTVAAAYPISARITLRGDEETIYSIFEEDIVAFVDLEKHHSEGIYKAPVKIEKRGTALNSESLEIKVEPTEIAFSLEKEGKKSLNVVPRFKGQPALGFELIEYSLEPSSIEVKGPLSQVENIANIATEEIDLTGKSEDFTHRTRLIIIDLLITTVGDPFVEFYGVIERKVGSEKLLRSD